MFTLEQHPGPATRRVLITTTYSDVHTWNLVYLALAVSEQGLSCAVLGPTPSAADVQAAVEEYEPDLVLVSSLNGHAHLEAPALLEAVRRAPGGQEIPVVLGGNLTTTVLDGSQQEHQLRAAGFAAVLQGERLRPEALPGVLREVLILAPPRREALAR